MGQSALPSQVDGSGQTPEDTREETTADVPKKQKSGTQKKGRALLGNHCVTADQR